MTNRGLLRRQMREAWIDTIRSAYMDQVISSAANQRYFVRLPPQHPWHKPRYQEIRRDRLQFLNQ